MDAATQRTIDRGRRNQEILKQPQYSPVSVEEQVAIIYVSTKGFIDKLPINKVKQFEKEFITLLRAEHEEVLDTLKSGKLTDEATEKLGQLAKDMTIRYQKEEE